MKQIFYILLITFTLLFSQDNFKLNGNYFAEIDKRFNSKTDENYRINFGDSTYVKKLQSGKIILGKITRIKITDSKTILYLEDQNKENIETNDSIIKLWGNEVLELVETKNDTIKFRSTFRRNLHLTRIRGKLIKLEK